jgi:hypothetical protein
VDDALRKAAKHLKIPTQALFACRGGEGTNVPVGADSGASEEVANSGERRNRGGESGGERSVVKTKRGDGDRDNNSSASGHSLEHLSSEHSSEPASSIIASSGARPEAVRDDEHGAGRAQAAGGATASGGEVAPTPALFQGCVVYFDGRTGVCLFLCLRVGSMHTYVCMYEAEAIHTRCPCNAWTTSVYTHHFTS